MRRTWFTMVFALLVAISPGCGRASNKQPAPAPAAGGVLTTFYPTTFFASRIAGGKVAVECPVPEGEDPIAWQPDREVIARYQAARLIVLNGAGYEAWTQSAALPLARVCDSSRGFESEFLRYESVTHSHGSSGAHSHEGTDGHTWLDPVNASRQVEAIARSMARAWPEHEKSFLENARALQSDLAELDARLDALRPAAKTATFVASHPAFNYLARRYGWKLVNTDIPPDAAPTQAVAQAVEDAIKSGTGSSVIVLFESEPIAEVAELVRGLRASCVVYEPAEMVLASEVTAGADFLSVMNRNIDRLTAALAASGKPGSPGVPGDVPSPK